MNPKGLSFAYTLQHNSYLLISNNLKTVGKGYVFGREKKKNNDCQDTRSPNCTDFPFCNTFSLVKGQNNRGDSYRVRTENVHSIIEVEIKK